MPRPKKPVFSIQAASKACGISPATLRLWEVRYKWPTPQRRPNGYRFYTEEQVEELKLVAQLLNQGHRIGQLIVEGRPEWPSWMKVGEKQVNVELRTTREIPAPENRSAARLHGEVLSQLEKKAILQLELILHRAQAELRASDEVLAVLAPIAFGVVELASSVGAISTEYERVLTQVLRRSESLDLRVPKPEADADIVLEAETEIEESLVRVLVLALRHRGIAASWGGDGDESERVVVSSSWDGRRRRLMAWLMDDVPAEDVFNPDVCLPWEGGGLAEGGGTAIA